MLAFVDESFQEVERGLFFTTYAAACLSRDASRSFSRDLCNLKRLFWKLNDPTEKELKGSLLLTERALTLPKNREFVDQILALLREYEVRVFAVTNKGAAADLKGKDFLPQSFQFLLERVDLHTCEAQTHARAAVIFDSIEDKSNRVIAKNVTNFLYRHGLGKSFEHILDFPLFGDSTTTPGLQVADLAAYAINAKCAGRRGYLEDVYLQIKALTRDWHNRRGDDQTDWGIRLIDSSHLLPGMASAGEER